MKNRIIPGVIVGPTAVGKTKYAVQIARKLNGEIVSADSMQIYRFMDIGSAKPTEEEQAAARHHLVDAVDPREPFSVAQYRHMAKECIEDIFQRDKLPVISGGTGLYVNALIYDMDFSAPPPTWSRGRNTGRQRKKKVRNIFTISSMTSIRMPPRGFIRTMSGK